MTTTTTAFVEQRLKSTRGQAVRRAGRRFAGSWHAALHLTAQERAEAYVARTPVAVLAG